MKDAGGEALGKKQGQWVHKIPTIPGEGDSHGIAGMENLDEQKRVGVQFTSKPPGFGLGFYFCLWQ